MWGVTATAPDAAPADQERKAPGRPRSPRADEAIIEAVLDLLGPKSRLGWLAVERAWNGDSGAIDRFFEGTE